MNIQERIQEIFRIIFDDEEIILSRATSADDIEEWDSFGHITLIDAIEKEFEIRFNSDHIFEIATVGDLIDMLNKHLQGEQ